MYYNISGNVRNIKVVLTQKEVVENQFDRGTITSKFRTEVNGLKTWKLKQLDRNKIKSKHYGMARNGKRQRVTYN